MSKLKRQRKMCGYTQHDIARLAAIPIGRLVFAETGRSKLRADELARIKTVLSQRVKEIVEATA